MRPSTCGSRLLFHCCVKNCAMMFELAQMISDAGTSDKRGMAKMRRPCPFSLRVSCA
jgi:hypothetical protein